VRHFQPMNANFGLLPHCRFRFATRKKNIRLWRSIPELDSAVADAWSQLQKKTGP
jgi:folate-dependent tRNA-U54 methylase TrmFO/GidA